MSKNKIHNNILNIALCLIMFAIGAISGFSIYTVTTIESDKLVFSSDSLQIHFLELGNVNAGDCIYIKAGNTDILVDGGSKANSLPTIKQYVDQFVEDNTIEYGIVTHAHQDHYACFASETSLFDYYKFNVLIDFAQTNNEDSRLYENYLEEKQEEIQEDNMVNYSILDCMQEKNGAKKEYELSDGITLKFLDSAYYYEESSDENNHSVCFLITQGENNYLFTGDLEKEGEEKLVEMNELPKCVLYKAGHHGSKTSSSEALLSIIDPEYVVVTCVAGSYEYTQNSLNTFPTQEFINRVSKYTENVYVTSLATVEYDTTEQEYENIGFTSMNGNIVVYSSGNDVNLSFTNNDLKLKDTEWYKANRTSEYWN